MAQSTADDGTAAGEGDIIVTAQRRAEKLQDVPISITPISQETLERANVQQLSDIAKLSPATRFDYQAARAVGFALGRLVTRPPRALGELCLRRAVRIRLTPPSERTVAIGHAPHPDRACRGHQHA